jgi:hypothetical protein
VSFSPRVDARHSGAARHGFDHEAGFAVYHRVLSLGRWSSRAVAHRLLLLLVAALVPAGPIVIGLHDTIERRWGPKSRRAGFIVILFGLITAILSEPAACAGCA